MLVHFKVVKDGQPTHERVANENEAQRVFGKAMEKGAVFIACHQGTEMPDFVEAKAHDGEVKAAHRVGHADMLAKLAGALGLPASTDEAACFGMIEELRTALAAANEPASEPTKRGPGRPRKSTEE